MAGSLLEGRFARHVITAALLALPFVAHYAAKGIVALLIASAALVLIDAKARKTTLKGGWRWIAVSFGPLLAYALLTAPLAVEPDHSALLVLRVLMLVGAACVIWCGVESQEETEKRGLMKVLAASGLLLLALVGLDLFTDLAVMRWIKNLEVRPGSNDYKTYVNNGVAVLAFLSPLFALAIGRSFGKIAALGFLALTLLLIHKGNASTPMLGMGLAALGFTLASFLGKRALRLVALLFAVGILSFPYAFEGFLNQPLVINNFLYRPNGGLEALEQRVNWSSLHRLYIWSFAVGKISEKPVIGWGFDSSREIPGGHEKVLGYQGVELMPLHPHNGALQVRMELGLVGTLSFVFLLWRLASGIGRLDGDRWALSVATAMFAAYAGPGMLSFGLWQNWWLANLALCAPLLAICYRPDGGGNDPDADPG